MNYCMYILCFIIYRRGCNVNHKFEILKNFFEKFFGFLPFEFWKIFFWKFFFEKIFSFERLPTLHFDLSFDLNLRFSKNFFTSSRINSSCSSKISGIFTENIEEIIWIEGRETSEKLPIYLWNFRIILTWPIQFWLNFQYPFIEWMT